MRMRVEVSEVGRNLATFVDRVQKENVTFVLVSNGAVLARLEPVNEKRSNGQDVAAALERLAVTSRVPRLDLRKSKKH
jgi:hypothetical protein